MRSLAYAAIVGTLTLFALGCKDPAGTSGANAKSAPEPPKTSANAPSGGGGETIAPMGGLGAGPMTPVAGTDSVQGGGSGVGQVMKDRARGIAGNSPSSVNQMPADDGN